MKRSRNIGRQKGSVDAYFRTWPEPEELTEAAIEQLTQRPADHKSVPPAQHQAVNDPVEVEAELPEPASLSDFPEAERRRARR